MSRERVFSKHHSRGLVVVVVIAVAAVAVLALDIVVAVVAVVVVVMVVVVLRCFEMFRKCPSGFGATQFKAAKAKEERRHTSALGASVTE